MEDLGVEEREVLNFHVRSKTNSKESKNCSCHQWNSDKHRSKHKILSILPNNCQNTHSNKALPLPCGACCYICSGGAERLGMMRRRTFSWRLGAASLCLLLSSPLSSVTGWRCSRWNACACECCIFLTGTSASSEFFAVGERVLTNQQLVAH